VYTLDEYRTSCLHHKTEQKCGNLYLPDKKGKMRKMHSILTYQMEVKRKESIDQKNPIIDIRKGCINRDNNAVNNMISIVLQYLKDKTRPYRFMRGVKLEEIKNDANPREIERQVI